MGWRVICGVIRNFSADRHMRAYSKKRSILDSRHSVVDFFKNGLLKSGIVVMRPGDDDATCCAIWEAFYVMGNFALTTEIGWRMSGVEKHRWDPSATGLGVRGIAGRRTVSGSTRQELFLA
jgi:hypothetical protein